jgi:hypothetical protein
MPDKIDYSGMSLKNTGNEKKCTMDTNTGMISGLKFSGLFYAALPF